MNISERGLTDIRESEGLRLDAYQDKGGVWTIGYGTTRYPDGRPVRKGESCTLQEAEAWLHFRVAEFETTVNQSLKTRVNRPMFDALVSMAYNVGSGAFASSTLVRQLNAANYIEAQIEFDKWIKVRGGKDGGLVNRRNKEQRNFNDGIRLALVGDPDALASFNAFVDETDIG